MANDLTSRLVQFAKYAEECWDEKGHSQVFLEKLFRAFGHQGYKEAGAILEDRVKRAKGNTNFADLTWPTRKVLLEMKKRGEKLAKHFPQLRGYWLDTKGWRAKYLVLCNFEEFWVYDTDVNTNDPVEKFRTEDIVSRWSSLGFLFPEEQRPLFENNATKISADVAEEVAGVFTHLVEKQGEDPERAQRFVLQCVLCMFSEDFGLLPENAFTQALVDCKGGQSTYDLLGGLFRQMNAKSPARGGRFKNVPYFNGGLFTDAEALDLPGNQIEKLLGAAQHDWTLVDPSIFGTIFQYSMGEDSRHAHGAHYTSEADIQKVVLPTIVQPWRARIRDINTLKGLLAIRQELVDFKVLDPACGSGNFLYVAYRELRRLELAVLLKLRELFPKNKASDLGCGVSIQQFFGFDLLPFAVEVAKVTMMLAKELSIREIQAALDDQQMESDILIDPALPLDNLDSNIRVDDALFCEWPKVNAIIGNPPFQSKNNMQAELGRPYINRLRDRYSEVPGRADYCVYFFRRSHDELIDSQRAGLVGTNTIRETYSRQGGLDYIVGNGGTITNAVATQHWSGDAAVHVSIVNWIRGEEEGPMQLAWQDEKGVWTETEMERIPSSLSADIDVASAKKLKINSKPKTCHQGQTHGHEGFLMTREDAEELLATDKKLAEVVFPFLTISELLSRRDGLPTRYVIDFFPRDIFGAQQYQKVFPRIESRVLSDRKAAAKKESNRNEEAIAENPKARVNRHHANFLSKWWLLSYPRGDMVQEISRLSRYIACGRVTKRPIFSFVDSGIRPNDLVIVFAFEDDYSFGIMQSSAHWAWAKARCSTLEERLRYTSNTIYATFPWPQSPSKKDIRAVADAAVELRAIRAHLMDEYELCLRDLYRVSEKSEKNQLVDAQASLDRAVATAYGVKPGANHLQYLLDLNHDCAHREAKGEVITGPGLPPVVEDRASYISEDCLRMPD